jgi:hypothetical protein
MLGQFGVAAQCERYSHPTWSVCLRGTRRFRKGQWQDHHVEFRCRLSGDLAGQIYIGQRAWHPTERTKSIIRKRRCKEQHMALVIGAAPQCQGNIGSQTTSGRSDALLLPLILQAEARSGEQARAIGETVEMVALQ